MSKRIVGARWTVCDEYSTISQAACSEKTLPPIPWAPAPLHKFADSYAAIDSRLQRSVVLRIRSSEVIRRESSIAKHTEAALRADAGFSTIDWPTSSNPVDRILDECGTQLLIGPGTPALFDDARATLIDRDFGVPSCSFAELADPDKSFKSDWGNADPEIAYALDMRVRKIAAERLATSSIDFNGRLARLAGWRVERSHTSPSLRIHLLLERTNFASLLATNGGLHIQHDDGCSHNDIARGSLAQSTPAESWTANALAIHLVLVTADRKIVLVRRSEQVEWGAGQLNTAVNGVVELSGGTYDRSGDEDDSGFVDVFQTALREASEEIGDHLCIVRESVVARALALNSADDQITPYLIAEVRTPLTFEEISGGHFAHVCRHEGAFEVGEEMVGLPLDQDTEAVVGWLRVARDNGSISQSGLASTLMTLGHVLTPSSIGEAWNRSSRRTDGFVSRHTL